MKKDFLEELDSELLWEDPIENTQPVVSQEEEKQQQQQSVPVKEQIPQKERQKQSFPQKKFAQENRKESNDAGEWDEHTQFLSLKQTMMSNFPEVKFYLPAIRPGYTRFIPIGGNNETGAKNMNLFQYGDDILLVDCGIQFAEPDMLGANCSIPDISFLIPYKKILKGL